MPRERTMTIGLRCMRSYRDKVRQRDFVPFIALPLREQWRRYKEKKSLIGFMRTFGQYKGND